MNGKSVEDLTADDIIQAMKQETAMQSFQALAEVGFFGGLFIELMS
jgi:hypothetical protein